MEFLAPQPLATTSYQPTVIVPTRGMDVWEWVIIIIIVIIIILIIIWMIWHFGFRETGLPPGSTCTANRQCQNGTYCSSGGKCKSGTGRKNGERCAENSDCLIGLQCVKNSTGGSFCRSEFIPIPPDDHEVIIINNNHNG